MELHGYVGIQRVWAWAQVVPMDNLVDGQRGGRWVMGWIWTSSTRPKPDPLPSLPVGGADEAAGTVARVAGASGCRGDVGEVGGGEVTTETAVAGDGGRGGAR